MTAAPNSAPRSVIPRWIKFLLVASLALNLLVIGAVSTVFWRLTKYGPHAQQAFGTHASLFGFAATLPAERRREIWRDSSAHRPALRALRGDARAARQAVQEQLLADPFDTVRFSEAQARLQEAEGRARTEAQKALLVMVSRLTREERLAFAKWREMPHNPGRRGGRIPGTPDVSQGEGGKPSNNK